MIIAGSANSTAAIAATGQQTILAKSIIIQNRDATTAMQIKCDSVGAGTALTTSNGINLPPGASFQITVDKSNFQNPISVITASSTAAYVIHIIE